MDLFESPLLIRRPTEFRRIRFAEVELGAELVELRQQLNDIVASTASQLPSPLRRELKSILKAYAAGKDNFFALFYVPVWSFLHWATAAAQREVTGDALSEAKTAHALSLFLHLWDDHLCDGQLQVNVLRLQFRTLAWQRFLSAAYRFCELSSLPKPTVDEHVATYLTAQHSTEDFAGTDEYCAAFSSQAAICTLVPRLLGRSTSSTANADDLYHAVLLFLNAWRLLDDIQDVDVDVMTHRKTAVWLELNAAGRARWQSCRDASLHKGELDMSAWAELCDAISDSGCLTRLRARIDRTMSEAIEIGRANRWPQLVRELEQMQRGIQVAQ